MKRTAGILVIAALVSGCDSYLLDTCVTDYITATLPGTVSVDGDPVATELSNRIARSNLTPPTFDALQEIVEDASETAAVFAFDIQNFSANIGPAVGLSVLLRTPAPEGRVYTVTEAFNGGGWGLAALPAGVDVRVGIRVGELLAESVSGRITVLDPSPLLLRVNLDGVAADGRTLHVEGDITFDLVSEQVSCT